MTDDNNSNIGLSRRRVLGGIGAIGIASAGAGLGTTAYFSDQETFSDNTITAGSFSLEVKQSVQHLDQDGMGPDQAAYENGAGEDGIWVQSPIDIEDAKPGDEYKFCWDITVGDNPGYVVVVGDSDEQNGVDAENVNLDDLWDIDDEADLSTLGESATATLTTTVDGVEHEQAYGSLADLLASLESGIIVSDDEGAVTFQPGETVTVCLDVTIPTDVGNEIQGATLTSSMTFYAEQARHNDAASVLDNAMGLSP
ncbi:SipW-dependent-type signal peptide-containing protein [Natronorubrum thiooxidans]|uniref:SipW-cognate class signal peptide n=1 Tax=Natronorubrum thiooxidans TaxID=308853 RepID=A0A1N7GYW8_9EURY|nr:SipW-dependent-type signal peptide-containing protein [Natronorubrum thiooxidans]SIS17817.1 SipW-cognate class signal peptide [Natronorubrum thiooxidans]